jgi:hypothetical protein
MKNFKPSHAAVGRAIFVIGIAILALSAGWPRFVHSWAQETPNRAGLVIQHGDGRVVTRCVSFQEETISGYDLLAASGLDLNIAADSVGTSICRLDGEGCTFPQDQCFCQCTSQPCLYWSYWRQSGGGWGYSQLGASNTQVHDGDVEGWVWGEGSIGSPSDSQPPTITFDDICNPQTPTPEPTATDTPTPTPTSPPTNTPPPTFTTTATPIPPPLITFFAPDRDVIAVGEPVVLRWETVGADAVVLRKPDGEQTLGASGSLTFTPATTIIYELVARNAAGEDRVQTTVTVQEPAQLPGQTPVQAPTAAVSVTPESITPPVPVETTPTPTLTPIIVPPPAATAPAPAQPAAPTATPTLAVIVVAAPAATTPPSAEPPTAAPTETPTSVPTEAPTSTSTETPTAMPMPTATPAPVAVNALEGSTAALADDVASVAGESTSGSSNAETTAADATEAGQPSEATQLLPIFTGMAFVLGVPLLLGMAWLGYQSWRRKGR